MLDPRGYPSGQQSDSLGARCPRTIARSTLSDAQVEHMGTLTLEAKPREATHWSTRAMAARCGLSQSAVSRIWRAFGPPRHRTEALKLSKDPLFVEKVRDIVGLYLHPPDRALVLSPTRSRKFRPSGGLAPSSSAVRT
jgi:hypothetical protein